MKILLGIILAILGCLALYVILYSAAGT